MKNKKVIITIVVAVVIILVLVALTTWFGADLRAMMLRAHGMR